MYPVIKRTHHKQTKNIAKSLVIIFNLFYSLASFGQFNISIQSQSFIDYCNHITYEIEIEKAVSTTFQKLSLEIHFSDAVIYDSNTLDLKPTDVTSTFMRFSVGDIDECLLQKGTVTVIPECYDIFTNIEASFFIKSESDCLAESVQESVIKNPFMDCQFSDYVYDATLETLTKSITLFNAGSIGIRSFYLLPRIDQDFASLSSASLGSVRNDTLFIDESHLNGSTLSTGNELLLELTYKINRCDIRTIDYELGYQCTASNCQTTQQFVDENDIYQNNVQGFLDNNQTGFLNALNYGICEPLANKVTFKNSILQSQTSIGDIYNIGYTLEIENQYSRRFTECLSLSASVGGQAVEVLKQSETQYLIFFYNLTTDPDGRGGIDDLDGDGQYDDIPLGDSTNFDLLLQLNDSCFENYENLAALFTLIPSYSNYCQLMSNGRSSANREDAFLSNHFNVTFPLIEEFKRDQSNKRFLDNGEEITATIRIRPSQNVTDQCNTKDLLLTLDVPKKLQYDSTKEIIYYDNNDTIILIPNIINDTLLEFSFSELDSSQTFIDISFKAICDINTDTNFDSAIDVCNQCIEYNTESLRAELSKSCNLNCGATAISRQGRTAPFYTRCEDVPALQEPFELDGSNILNLSAGYVDKERTIKRDPYTNPSSINNQYFFDGDTMLIQIPFNFNCSQELQNYSITISESQLFSYEFNILDSEIILLEKNSTTEIGRCSASLFLSQSDSQILYSFDRSSFNLQCIDSELDHVLEIKIKFTYECVLGNNCGIVTSGTLRTLTDVTLQSGCSKRVFYDTDTVYINEVFKEEFFNPIENLFGLSTEIYDSIPMSFTLFPNIFNVKVAAKEFKDIPLLKEINYKIPQGYEILGDLKLIETRFFFLDTGDFLFSDETAGDTLLSMSPSIIQNPDGSTTYQFKNIPSDYLNGSILKPITGGVVLKSVCQPAENLQDITVSGIIEYVNYADDSRDLINYEFSETTNITFLPERFNAVDDFQIISSKLFAEWTYIKNVAFIFNSFNIGSNAFSEEQQYLFKYQSESMRVDSITVFVDDGFGLSSNIKIKTNSNYVGDSIIELTLLPRINVQGNGDTVIRDFDLDFLNIHTSNHACGFDSLFFELGRKSQFLKDSCASNIFSDFIVSYSPPGFPQLEFSNVPTEIKTFQSNQFEFTLSNIGQGELIENTIYFNGFPEGDYELKLTDKNELTDISQALEFQNDQLIINLTLVDLQQIAGLSGLNISEMHFVLITSNLCLEDPFLRINSFAESLSYCGDTIVSPISKTDRLPIISEEDLQFNLGVSAIADGQCSDTVQIRVTISTNQLQSMSNPIVEFIVPNDIFLYQNSTKINGQIIPDPISKVLDDDFSKVFVITEGLPNTVEDSITIDISFDGSCIDLCREDVISAFMMSEIDATCVSNNSSRYLVTRAYNSNQKVNWKQGLVFENVESALVASEGDFVTLEILGSITNVNTSQQSDAIRLYSFLDENFNEQYDEGELLFDEILIGADRLSSGTIVLKDSINVPSQYLCSLFLTNAIDDNCVCEAMSASIKQNGDLTLERTIQNCTTNSFPITLQFAENCLSDLEPNPNVMNMVDGILTYQPNLSLATDTINVINNCIGCLLTERVIIRNTDPNVNIQIFQASMCSYSARVLFNGETNIPEQFNILWHTGDDTPQIDNIKTGDTLKVSLIDQQFCQYNDSLFIQYVDEQIEYSLDTTSGLCSDESSGSAIITVTNKPSTTIVWNDGSEELSRPSLNPGDYSFTLTDNIGCSQIDNFSLIPTGGLNFNLRVINADCNATTSGQIQVESQDTTLQFSIDGNSFSKQGVFESLSAGTFTVYGMNDFGCLDSMTADIRLEDKFNSGLSLLLNAQLNQELSLNTNPIDQSDITWNWTSVDFELSCTDCSSPTIIANREGFVDVTVSTGICTVTESIEILITSSNEIYTPNIFHPNSSFGNELFSVFPHSSFDELDLSIYDRWGNQVFNLENISVSESEDIGWDGTFNGKDSIEGVYVYKANVRRFVDNTEIELLGDFMLVR